MSFTRRFTPRLPSEKTISKCTKKKNFGLSPTSCYRPISAPSPATSPISEASAGPLKTNMLSVPSTARHATPTTNALKNRSLELLTSLAIKLLVKNDNKKTDFSQRRLPSSLRDPACTAPCGRRSHHNFFTCTFGQISKKSSRHRR